jgi:hypothetical protein
MRSCSRPSLTRSRVHAFPSDLFLTTPAVASTRGLVEQFRLLCEIDSNLPRLVDHQEAYVPPCSRRLPSCPAGGVGHTQSLIASMIQRQRQIVAVPWRIRPRLRARSQISGRWLRDLDERSVSSGRRVAIEKDVATLIFHHAGSPMRYSKLAAKAVAPPGRGRWGSRGCSPRSSAGARTTADASGRVLLRSDGPQKKLLAVSLRYESVERGSDMFHSILG